MCGYAGFFNPSAEFLSSEGAYQNILKEMTRKLHHRGPDEQNTILSQNCGLAHTRLSVIDLSLGQQPMSINHLTIVYNGELYNAHELRKDILSHGISFRTNCDTEVILNGFLFYGPSFFEKLNGIFSFVIYDKLHKQVTLCRDPFGVKPLFYTMTRHTMVFASELKGLFAYPSVQAIVDSDGLNEIFGLGPARTPGSAIFKDIFECKPGHYIVYGNKLTDHTYFKIQTLPHNDSYEETIEKTGELVRKAIKSQMVSDVPICTFLSGGVDSSIVTALCGQELKKKVNVFLHFPLTFREMINILHQVPSSPSRTDLL